MAGYARDYGSALKRFFYRRGVARDVCEDLVQDVYVRLAKRVKKTKIEKPEAYLMITASSVWKDFLRKKQSHCVDSHVEYDDLRDSPEVFSPERVLQGKETVKKMIDALQALPKDTRNAYLLCRVNGFKRAVVAERLGISISAVDRHLMTATVHVAKEIGKEK